MNGLRFRISRILPNLPVFLGILSIAILYQTWSETQSARMEANAASSRMISNLADQLSLFAQLAPETLDRMEEAGIVRRLNRLIYGLKGVERIEVMLPGRKLRVENAYSNDGRYLNRNEPSRNCELPDPKRNLFIQSPKYGELEISLCRDRSEFLISKTLEANDADIGKITALVSPEGFLPEILPLRARFELDSNGASGSFQCGPGSWCEVRALPGLYSLGLGATLNLIWFNLSLSLFLAFLISKLLLRPLRNARDLLQAIAEGRDPNRGSPLGFLFSGFETSIQSLEKLARENNRLREDAAMARARSRIAGQIAHDIRSPLSSLQGLGREVEFPHPEQRVIYRNALNRISDIAHGLLLENDSGKNTRKQDSLGPTLLYHSADSIVSEIRNSDAFALKSLELQIETTSDAALAFIPISSVRFKRVLANLLTNAVEAAPEKSLIEVGLSSEGGSAILVIRDHGAGIPDAILPRLGSFGVTGKSDGNGIGLQYSIESIRSAGGDLHFRNHPEGGAEFKIVIPVSDPPAHLQTELILKAGSRVLVLDDDPSLLETWLRKLQRSGFEAIGISAPQASPEFLAGFDHFLIDFDLGPRNPDGLTFARLHGIQGRTSLTTSYSDDSHVKVRARENRIRIIPKAIIPYIRITPVNEAASATTILVDDDPLVAELWRYQAKKSAANFVVYPSGEKLLREIHRYLPETRIFIDFHLSGSETGAELAQELYKRGYSNLHYATGLPPGKVPHEPCIRSINGKSPPMEWEEKSAPARQVH